jgi:hypothetical protein
MGIKKVESRWRWRWASLSSGRSPPLDVGIARPLDVSRKSKVKSHEWKLVTGQNNS